MYKHWQIQIIMASMQKFGGVQVLPLLPASMRREQEEKVGNDGGEAEATNKIDSKNETDVKKGVDDQRIRVPISPDSGLQVPFDSPS